jgi:hypothetical protein
MYHIFVWFERTLLLSAGLEMPMQLFQPASTQFVAKRAAMHWQDFRPLHYPSANGSMAQRGIREMISRPIFRRPDIFATAVALLAALALTASPARADRCDDLAGQLKNQIDGLGVGKTAANVIYLSHPLAKQMTLGCAGRNYANLLYAKADSRKPSAAFLDLVAGAAAIIFTLPKDDMLKGATRCIKRMGLFHGDDVATRYRRLDMNCKRTKTEATISISRGTDE